MKIIAPNASCLNKTFQHWLGTAGVYLHYAVSRYSVCPPFERCTGRGKLGITGYVKLNWPLVIDDFLQKCQIYWRWFSFILVSNTKLIFCFMQWFCCNYGFCKIMQISCFTWQVYGELYFVAEWTWLFEWLGMTNGILFSRNSGTLMPVTFA
jgi:hypothetical protein